jgi:hypothetical protein
MNRRHGFRKTGKNIGMDHHKTLVFWINKCGKKL